MHLSWNNYDNHFSVMAINLFLAWHFYNYKQGTKVFMLQLFIVYLNPQSVYSFTLGWVELRSMMLLVRFGMSWWSTWIFFFFFLALGFLFSNGVLASKNSWIIFELGKILSPTQKLFMVLNLWFQTSFP